MKVCFVGLGSIGCRHINNLKSIINDRQNDLEIHAFRESNKVLNEEIKELIDREIFKVSDLDDDYDIVFITNPTNMHYDTINKFILKTKNIFIEKPVFDHSQYDWKQLLNNKINDNGIYYVAAPLRYTKVLESIKRIVNENKVYSVRCICSSYLPDWRPNVDYRSIYSAHSDQGGGVSIDCIHELDYLFYLFGFPINSYNIKGQYSHLEIDSDDLSIYIFKYDDKLIEVHLDYFGKNKERTVEIYTEKGRYIGDFYRNEIRYPDGKIESFDTSPNYMYIKELETFLDMINGNSINENSIEHSIEVLRFAEGGIK